MAGEAYAKRYGAGGFVDLPTQTTSIDSQFLNSVEAALVRLLGADPTDDSVMVWDAALGRFKTIKLTASEISPSAAIAKTQLAPLQITDADVAAGANISKSKLNLGASLNIVQRDLFTASGTYSTPSTATRLLVECFGGGGGSGGAPLTGAANDSLGTPGGGGAYAQKLITGPVSSYVYTVGAAGAAGAAGGNGGAGGDTFFGAATLAGSPCGAKGGSGGVTTGPSSVLPFTGPAGGGGGAGSSIGDLVLQGLAGDDGIALSVTYQWPGKGGAAARGSAGGQANNAGIFPGGGGGGTSLGPSSAAIVGKVGGAGLIMVTAFA